MHGTQRRPSLQGTRWKPWAARTERIPSLMDKRLKRRFWREREPSDLVIFDPQVTIETPNYPENYPNKAKCSWRIKVPANEEVHIWCETFDLLKGDFLSVSINNFGSTILILWLQIKRVKNKIFGTFEDGYGEIVPATKKARWLRLQFRSNRKKSAGGFRCQVSLQCGSFFFGVEYFYWLWNIIVQILQFLPQIAAVTPGSGSGSGSG